MFKIGDKVRALYVNQNCGKIGVITQMYKGKAFVVFNDGAVGGYRLETSLEKAPFAAGDKVLCKETEDITLGPWIKDKEGVLIGERKGPSVRGYWWYVSIDGSHRGVYEANFHYIPCNNVVEQQPKQAPHQVQPRILNKPKI